MRDMLPATGPDAKAWASPRGMRLDGEQHKRAGRSMSGRFRLPSPELLRFLLARETGGRRAAPRPVFLLRVLGRLSLPDRLCAEKYVLPTTRR